MAEKFNAKDLLKQAKELKQTTPQPVAEVVPEQKDSADAMAALNDIMNQNEALQKENTRLTEGLGQLNNTYHSLNAELEKKTVAYKAMEDRMEELGIENEVLRLDKDDLQAKFEATEDLHVKLALAEIDAGKSRDSMEGAYEVISKKTRSVKKWKVGTLAALIAGFSFGFFIRTPAEKPKDVVQVVNGPLVEEPVKETPVVVDPVKEAPVVDHSVQPAYHRLLLQEIIVENKYFTPEKEASIKVRVLNEGVKETNVNIDLYILDVGVFAAETIPEIDAGQEVIEDIVFRLPGGIPSGTYELSVSLSYSNYVEAENLTKEFKVASNIHDLIREKYGKK